MTATPDRITAAGWRIVLLASLGGTLELLAITDAVVERTS